MVEDPPILLHNCELLQTRCVRDLPCRRVLRVLGGAFDYQAATAELAAARRSAKQLLRGQAGVNAGRDGSCAEPPEAEAAATSGAATAASHEEDMWGSFEAFSAAVAAEVDERIAAARLHPLPTASERLHRQNRPQPPVQHTAAAAPARKPLAGLEQGGGPARQAAGAGGPERKRGRSPHLAEQPESRSSRTAAAATAAAPAPAVAGPSSSKRQRPHVAFGSQGRQAGAAECSGSPSAIRATAERRGKQAACRGADRRR